MSQLEASPPLTSHLGSFSYVFLGYACSLGFLEWVAMFLWVLSCSIHDWPCLDMFGLCYYYVPKNKCYSIGTPAFIHALAAVAFKPRCQMAETNWIVFWLWDNRPQKWIANIHECYCSALYANITIHYENYDKFWNSYHILYQTATEKVSSAAFLIHAPASAWILGRDIPHLNDTLLDRGFREKPNRGTETTRQKWNYGKNQLFET